MFYLQKLWKNIYCIYDVWMFLPSKQAYKFFN